MASVVTVDAFQLITEAFSLDEAKRWAKAEYEEALKILAGVPTRWTDAQIATGLVPLQLATLLADVSAAKDWDAGFLVYYSKRAIEVGHQLQGFVTAKDTAIRCSALLNACSFPLGPQVSMLANLDWRYFSLTDLDTLSPTPSSELVRRIGILVAVECQEALDAGVCQGMFMALLGSDALNRSAAGFAVESAVLSALTLERLLPVSVLKDLDVELPVGHVGRGSHGSVKLRMQLFASSAPMVDYTIANLLVPYAFNYQHVDGIIQYKSVTGKMVVLGVQISLKAVKSHLSSLEFDITGGHWRQFVADDARETAQAGLIWITPEVGPVLPASHGVRQAHLPLEHFRAWVPQKMYVPVSRTSLPLQTPLPLSCSDEVLFAG